MDFQTEAARKFYADFTVFKEDCIILNKTVTLQEKK